MDSARIREDFLYLRRLINGKPIIYFDNAATTQKPRQVVEALVDYYGNSCANIHRGVHTLSQESSELYDEARRTVARFINADEQEIIFVRNTTEAINLVNASLVGEGTILTSVAEHHSNLLPWAIRREVDHVDIDDEGLIDLKDLRRKLSSPTLLVAVTHISNVLGLVNPVREVIAEARRAGALTLVDGAQSVPHMTIDVKELDCDFLVFSGHKMLGPSGVGVLYVRQELYNRMLPFQVGGSTIKEAHLDGQIFDDPPLCFEAGTPNIEGAIALGRAIDYLADVGMEAVEAHDRKLMEYALERMAECGSVDIYGSRDPEKRLAVITFNVQSVGCHSVAKVLCLRENIMIRSGFHCAQPLHDRLGIGPSARVSFYLYNSEDEIDHFAKLIGRLARFI